ncbi:MAG: EscU/YscU/HrcU family type III secretion system export apparatus switch protein [Thiobacillus sp.]
MAEESDLSRTEPASPRRLQQARNEGDVPRSAELTAWVVLLSALAALAWWAPQLFVTLTLQFQTALQSVAQPFPVQPFAPWLSVATMLLPLLALIFIALVIAPMLLSGWVFAPGVLSFNAQRLDPLLGFKRLFSLDGVFVIAKTLLKFALIIGVCWLTLSGEWTHLWALPIGSVAEASRAAASLLFQGLLAVVGTLAVIAAIDAGWQWWRYRVRHAMTWQEVLAEAKDSEGSPEMRGRMLGRQQAAAAQSAQPYGRLIDEVIE